MYRVWVRGFERKFEVLILGVGWAGVGAGASAGASAGCRASPLPCALPCPERGWGWELSGAGAGAGAGALGLGLWGMEIGLEWGGIHFNENSKLMKMQFKAKFTQFLFILLLRV